MLRNLEGKLRAEDAWEIVGVLPGQRTQHHNERLGEAMRELGWTRKKLRFGGPAEWCYVRGESHKQIELHRDYGDQLEARPEDWKPPF